MSGLAKIGNNSKTIKTEKIHQAFISPFRSVSSSKLLTNKTEKDAGTHLVSSSVSLEVLESNSYKTDNSKNIKYICINPSVPLPCELHVQQPEEGAFSTPKQGQGHNLARRITPKHHAFKTPFKSPIISPKTPITTELGQSPSLKRTLSSKDSLTETPKRSSTSHRIYSLIPRNLTGNNPENELKLLQEREKNLDIEISSLEGEGYDIKELQVHIDKLHCYNDLKDTAQMVMGRLAEMEGSSLLHMHKKYGVDNIE